ncbi:hypothetical protein, partial [Herbaspirillum lusitanum]|uniref:hypothetical protein n=1 Tax=Herbaspirillum lusitanum TaxID=213312 RepID=UPI001EE63B22
RRRIPLLRAGRIAPASLEVESWSVPYGFLVGIFLRTIVLLFNILRENASLQRKYVRDAKYFM